ncbi:coenzyme F420-0:L-glutamate ligase [Roseisalinus antarcticus]|uniref:Coenzyme F420:L-glutamate ligase n=1 Tax=Roseisalinus antarcticus TaxID=254357 RepID=A0A1Y5TUM4_9RHOB|nr:coenzyme F420-0:L-glutamate ligase [Roseisalinus antarcticus]SLN70548.1 Coenzyme F420:L-glutamate ligase [Roseisalinus antarcticus]
MTLTITPLPGLPMVAPGDDLAELLCAALDRAGILPAEGDVIVVAQKIVSKAEGQFRRLADIAPTDAAVRIAEQTRKDPRLVQAILDESVAVVRSRPGVLIVRHRLGFVLAQAGIDQSNIDHGEETVLLLPKDPDGSAAALRSALAERLGTAPAIVIADSFGRPFRNGVTGTAIGSAGVVAHVDRRGETDLFGRVLQVSTIAHADEIAAAASLVMGQAAEGIPAAHLRGQIIAGPGKAADLIRDPETDLFA